MSRSWPKKSPDAGDSCTASEILRCCIHLVLCLSQIAVAELPTRRGSCVCEGRLRYPVLRQRRAACRHRCFSACGNSRLLLAGSVRSEASVAELDAEVHSARMSVSIHYNTNCMTSAPGLFIQCFLKQCWRCTLNPAP